MRSRAAQLVLIAAATAAAAGAAVFVNISEQRIAAARSTSRAFDAVVREVTNSVAEFRSEGVVKSLDALRSMATTGKARASIERAWARATDFTEIAEVLDEVNAARVAEQEAADASEASHRRFEAIALTGVGVVCLAAMGGLLFTGPVGRAPAAEPPASAPEAAVSRPDDLLLRGEAVPEAGYMTSRPAGPVLRAASQLCTDLGRVSDAEELRDLIGRAAELMDASGLIVWTGIDDRGELTPAFSYGYAPEMVARLPPLDKAADNAAAKGFRTGQVQIVLARPGTSNGAIVAPVLSPAGCVGVVSAEIRGGGESSESVQALAAIFAAQLAGVLHTTAEAPQARRATGTHAI
jgi:hypothetical protein